MRQNRYFATQVVLGCLLLLLGALGLYFQQRNDLDVFITLALAQGGVYLVAVWVVLKEGRFRGLIPVLVFALLLRMAALATPPYLSDDIYRYVWDGRVQAAGINPYRFVPESRELLALRDGEIYPRINRRGYAPTIYPPLAEALFLAGTRISESVTWVKLLMIAFEALTVWILVRLLRSLQLPPERVLIYAWNPLAIWEFAGSGHIDAAAIAYMVLAVWARRCNRPGLTGLSLACATLTKLYPAMIFPALYRRWDWKMPAAFGAAVVLAYLPFVSVGRRVLGFLPAYVEEEGLISGERFYPWKLIHNVWAIPQFDGVAYLAILLLVLLAVAGWLTFRKERHPGDFLTHSLVLAALTTVLFSPHYPWYFAWLLPLLVVVPDLSLLYLTLAAFVLYRVRTHETPDSLFSANTWLYLPFVVLVTARCIWHRFKWQIHRSVHW